ncbi:TWiK family of potassium channels protein 18 [Bacillus rossius redtenbacheri]|uniref:TWiK family of potassium channels protein 18 n=1 Tax=Bacillus rossius redtenbacheri TaxID=93214 RepID=UPI002FDE9A04
MERRHVRRRRYRSREKNWTQKCKDYLRHFVAFMFSNVGIIGLVVSYTIAGAFIFIAIENRKVIDGNVMVMREREILAKHMWKLTYDMNVFNESHWKKTMLSELQNYQEKVVEAIRLGFDGTDNVGESFQWTFPGAFLYALTVITTIGYGNVTPRTEWGKLTTILYAIVGMPLFLLYLSNIGDILAKSFKWTYAKICLCRGWGTSRRRGLKARSYPQQKEESRMPTHDFASTESNWKVDYMPGEINEDPNSIRLERVASDGLSADDDDADVEGDTESSESARYDQEYDPQTVTVPLTLCLAVMVGYVCFGAVLFSEWESWNFLDGSYFCFISLSTIGFGDIVPGDNIYNKGIDLSFIFCSMYLMLGMALIAMSFNLMQEEVVHKMRTFVRRLTNMCSCRRRRTRDQG